MKKQNRAPFGEIAAWLIGPACGCIAALAVLIWVFVLGWWLG